MKKTFSFLSILVALNGCIATDGSQQRQAKYEIEECHKLGFKDDSDEMLRCRRNIRETQAKQGYDALDSSTPQQNTFDLNRIHAPVK